MIVALVYHTKNLYNLAQDCASMQRIKFHCQSPRAAQDFQWLEFYAGKANCTMEMRRNGYNGARFDKLYCKNPKKSGRKTNWMDITTPAGFAFQDCNYVCHQRTFKFIDALGSFHHFLQPENELSLAIVFIMKGQTREFISWFGIKCSSFVSINAGTSKRSKCNSIGLPCASVIESNLLLERTPGEFSMSPLVHSLCI